MDKKKNKYIIISYIFGLIIGFLLLIIKIKIKFKKYYDQCDIKVLNILIEDLNNIKDNIKLENSDIKVYDKLKNL